MNHLSLSRKIERGVSLFVQYLFSYPTALIQVLDGEEGRIVSNEGQRVLADPQTMQNIQAQIREQQTKGKKGSIVVEY
jgi:hypothetical protein